MSFDGALSELDRLQESLRESEVAVQAGAANEAFTDQNLAQLRRQLQEANTELRSAQDFMGSLDHELQVVTEAHRSKGAALNCLKSNVPLLEQRAIQAQTELESFEHEVEQHINDMKVMYKKHCEGWQEMPEWNKFQEKRDQLAEKIKLLNKIKELKLIQQGHKDAIQVRSQFEGQLQEAQDHLKEQDRSVEMLQNKLNILEVQQSQLKDLIALRDSTRKEKESASAELNLRANAQFPAPTTPSRPDQLSKNVCPRSYFSPEGSGTSVDNGTSSQRKMDGHMQGAQAPSSKLQTPLKSTKRADILSGSSNLESTRLNSGSSEIHLKRSSMFQHNKDEIGVTSQALALTPAESTEMVNHDILCGSNNSERTPSAPSGSLSSETNAHLKQPSMLQHNADFIVACHSSTLTPAKSTERVSRDKILSGSTNPENSPSRSVLSETNTHLNQSSMFQHSNTEFGVTSHSSTPTPAKFPGPSRVDTVTKSNENHAPVITDGGQQANMSTEDAQNTMDTTNNPFTFGFLDFNQSNEADDGKMNFFLGLQNSECSGAAKENSSFLFSNGVGNIENVNSNQDSIFCFGKSNVNDQDTSKFDNLF